MNRLEAALLDIGGYLEAERIPYMVIGGYANLLWGKPRLTEDLDLKLQLAEDSWASFVSRLGTRFKLLPDDPLTFVHETRVIPVRTPTSVRLDLVLAGLPYSAEAITRAVDVGVAGKTVKMCTAEDLILHKIVSDRIRDRDDVEGVIAVQGEALDREYLDPKIRELATGLEKPEILDLYRSCLLKAGLTAA